MVESELCVENPSCHDSGLNNELAVIYPPIITIKHCALIREMDKGCNNAWDMKLRHIFYDTHDINLLKVLSKSKNKNKTANICEILNHNKLHNRLKRPGTEEIGNSTNFRKKRSFVNRMPENYCPTGLPRQITEGNLHKIRSSVTNVKENHYRRETVARNVINLDQRNHKSNRIKSN